MCGAVELGNHVQIGRYLPVHNLEIRFATLSVPRAVLLTSCHYELQVHQ